MKNDPNGRYSRQSFLGADCQNRISRCVVGVVGLGGGGSHIVQQLSHIGFQQFVLFDGDKVEESNLNRMVGARVADVEGQTPKIHIATSMIRGLQPDAKIEAHQCNWQERPEALRRCQIVFGCVDSYACRAELERCTRRYLIAYIDIGMDVVVGRDGRPVIGGQVILSLPSGPCMYCMGYLTEENLGKEAAKYGDAGGNPQVIWSNGILASTAVGIAVEFLSQTGLKPKALLFTFRMMGIGES